MDRLERFVDTGFKIIFCMIAITFIVAIVVMWGFMVMILYHLLGG